jgi:hypothetical protein
MSRVRGAIATGIVFVATVIQVAPMALGRPPVPRKATSATRNRKKMVVRLLSTEVRNKWINVSKNFS